MICRPVSKADQMGLFVNQLAGRATSPSVFSGELTGTYASNHAAVSTTPIVVDYGDGGPSVMIVPSGNGLCIVTSGTSAFVQGVVSYVQEYGCHDPW
jgi:hypothetical protein